MADREKVIKGLECCLKESDHLYSNPCNGCPYEGQECIDRMKADALAMLKEQGKRKFLIDEHGNITPLPEIVRCKDCKHGEQCNKNLGEFYLCGKNIGTFETSVHKADWFCADGEQKSAQD